MSSPFGVGFDGIGQRNVSFASSLTKGTDEEKVVRIHATTPKTVILPSVEDKFMGVLKQIDAGDGVATVQVEGYVTLPYTGTAPGVGHKELVANGAGGVKTPATAGTGIYYWIVDGDATAQTVTLKL